MTINVSIITANVGGYDGPPEPMACEVIIPPREDEHSRLTAKRVKMLQTALPTEAPYVLWLDGNIRIRDSRFPVLAAEVTGDAPMGVFRHPRRDDVLDEAKFSHIEAPEKYRSLPLIEQVSHYRTLGLPYPSGLYCGGVVCWNMLHPTTRRLADAWWQECVLWTYQDQLSLPFVLWAHALKPAVFPIDILEPELWVGNRWIELLAHKRSD